MAKRNVAKVGAVILKILAVVLAFSQLPELQEALGMKASWAAILFTGASAAKDIILVTMDAIDDGEINGSVKIPKSLVLLALLVPAFLMLPSCVCVTDEDGTVNCTTDPAAIEEVSNVLLDAALDRMGVPPRAEVIPEK